jgi:acetoacetyl-CoA synthetase
MSPPALWVHALPQSTRLDTFRRYVNNKHDVALNDYPELHKWSVIEQAKFYQDLWDFCGVIASRPPSPFATVTERLWPRPQWYPGARLNFSENLLAVGLVAHPDKVAVSAFREGGTQAQHFTWRQLEQTTALYACALKHAGIEKGDRVAGE